MKVNDAIEKRRAYRALEDIEISEEIIEKLSKAVSFAPSCFNKQPWRFIFIVDKKKLKEFQPAFSEGNQTWTINSSMMVVAFTKNDLDCQIPKIDPKIEYAEFDTGLACAFLILQATELNLVAHPMAGFNAERVKEILKIPQNYKIICCIAIGKKSDDISGLSGYRLDDELNRPKRFPLNRIVFQNQFEEIKEK